MKKIWVFLFCFTCTILRGTDYHVSLINLENGDFKFFVMHGSRGGHVRGFFRKSEQKTRVLPEPEMSVTISGNLHHFFKTYGTVTFAIDNFYVKIESDRDVFLWGTDAEDRVYIYTTAGSRKKFRLDFKNVKAPVFFRTNNQNFEWIETKKYDIPPTEEAMKFYREPDKKKK